MSILKDIKKAVDSGKLVLNEKIEYIKQPGRHKVKLVDYAWINQEPIIGKKPYWSRGPAFTFEVIESTNPEVLPGMRKSVFFSLENAKLPLPTILRNMVACFNALLTSKTNTHMSKTFDDYAQDDDLENADAIQAAFLGTEIYVVGEPAKNPEYTNLKFVGIVK